MELVYLWVEDYKNIHKQGFNFSPRFECSFDGENLTIDEKKDYVSIFPENINVTAIVGENGSGKSNVLQQLLTKDKFGCSPFEENNNINKRLFIYDKDTKDIRHLNCEDLSFYNNVILYNEDVDSDLYKNEFNTNQLIYETIGINDRYKINNISIAVLSQIENISYINDITFVPTHIEFKFIKNVTLDSLIGYNFDYIDDIHDMRRRIDIDTSEIHKFTNFLNPFIENSISFYESNQDISKYLFLREFIFKLSKKQSKALAILEKLVLNNYQFEDNFYDNFILYLQEELYTHSDEEVFNDIISEFNSFDILNNSIKLVSNNMEKLLLNIHRGFFDINFFIKKNTTKIYFSDLSSGEQKLITFFAKIFYVARKAYNNKKDFLIILDEPDSYLHPNWQKQIFNYLLSFLQNATIFKDKQINIIITTHSPFILSDLPKENVLFLKDGKPDNPDIKHTFGANIHTLLSHGFFMKDGLMGEFAKGKIEEIKEFYYEVKQSENQQNLKSKYLENIDEFKNIQKIIGEPFLKTIMGNYLDELEQIFDPENYKKNQKEKLLNQFTNEELKKHLDSR